MDEKKPDTTPARIGTKLPWSKPQLASASIKELTANNMTSGGDGSMRMFSDERLKTDCRRSGESPSGLPIYQFKYLGSDRTYSGVLAQDLFKLMPSAVHKLEIGFYVVDYSQIDVEFTELEPASSQ